MNEYFTDGEDDLSADGINSFAADAYYRVVAADIRAMPAETPLTIGGGVAWVAAESAPGRFRLTLVDSAYIDPGDQTAVITLSTVTPLAVTDIPTDKRIRIEDARTARVPVACGVFRFLAVDMENAL